MKTLSIFLALLCAATSVVAAPHVSTPIELVLKLDPVPGQAISGNLAPYNGRPFYLVVRNGEAFLSEDEISKREADKHKGTVQFVYRNGVEPSTRARATPIFELRFRYVSSGWGQDKVVTEMVIPYSVQQRENGSTVVFSETATEDMLSEELLQSSFSFVGDVADVRYQRRLKCSEVLSKLNLSLR